MPAEYRFQKEENLYVLFSQRGPCRCNGPFFSMYAWLPLTQESSGQGAPLNRGLSLYRETPVFMKGSSVILFVGADWYKALSSGSFGTLLYGTYPYRGPI